MKEISSNIEVYPDPESAWVTDRSSSSKNISAGDLVRITYRKHELAAAIAVEPPDDYAPSVWSVLWGGEVRLVHIDNLEQITGGAE